MRYNSNNRGNDLSIQQLIGWFLLNQGRVYSLPLGPMDRTIAKVSLHDKAYEEYKYIFPKRKKRYINME